MSIRLSARRCEEIKNIVVDFFEKYRIDCVPISGFEIATKMGIEVLPYSSFERSTQKVMMRCSEDGFTVRNGDIIKIVYNQEKGYKRINHTFLHEIGHIVLNHTQDSELAEAEARFFAKYALAPPVLIHKLETKSAEMVSATFNISSEAAGYALEYYRKWLNFGANNYTEYEIRTLELFNNNDNPYMTH